MRNRLFTRNGRRATRLISAAAIAVCAAVSIADARPRTESIGPEAVVGGISRDDRVHEQFILSGELSEVMPEGAKLNPISVALTAQDLADLAVPTGSGEPMQIGVVKQIVPSLTVTRGKFGEGVTRVAADGSTVWAVTVTSPDAVAIRVHFTDFSLPAGVKLYFYNAEGEVDGPYTGAGRNNNGDFWTRSISANTGVIQLRYRQGTPAADVSKIAFTVSELAHIHLRDNPGAGGGGIASHDEWPCSNNSSCLVDANCTSGTPAEAAKDAVAKMEWIVGPSVFTCTGGLLADTVPATQIPYFMTANHCTSSSISNLETWFNYTTDSCNGVCPHNILTGGAPPSDTIGFTVLASSSNTDFSFGTLDQAAPAGAVFLGWNTTPVAFTNNLPLHRISNANFGPQVYSQADVDTGSGVCGGFPRGRFIYSSTNTGDTMGGSSGSPVVNGAGEVVGQLFGCCGINCINCNFVSNWTMDGAFAVTFPSIEEFLDPVAECTTDPDCDDANDCTTDVCNAGTCENTAVADNTACSGGVCCGGTCTAPACSADADCNDADLCTTDTCNNGGTCSASCSNTPVSCPAGESCDPADGLCKPDPCNNDGTCDAGEDCNNCANDCISDPGGTPGCDNGTCEPGEDCNNCPQDCRQKANGNPNSRFCCDGDLADCGDTRCSEGGFACGPVGPGYCCGDGTCEGAETSFNCAVDCGDPPVCGDASCDAGEDECSCPADCCAGAPATETGSCSDGCDNDCDGLTDGDDPDCACGERGDPCSVDGDCCSNRCKNNGTCR